METTQNLTREQRRMIVEHMATECVQEMPSEDMPRAEFFRDLHSEEWRIKTMKAIEKVIPEDAWKDLLVGLLMYQSFDRDPDGWLEEHGYTPSPRIVFNWRDSFNNEISAAINVAARY